MVNYENEIWKDIKGYEGRYQISNYGRVKSLKRPRILKDYIKKPTIDRDGYFEIALNINRKIKKFRLHRLVCEYFLDNYSEDLQVNHKNCVRIDNHIDNLEMVTAKENSVYSSVHGDLNKGENHPHSKFKDQQVLEIRRLYATGKYTQTQLAKMFNTKQYKISEIVLRKLWKHI